MIICIYTRTSTLAQRSGTSRSSRKAWDRSIWSTIRATRCGPMERSATSTQRTTLIFEFVSRMYTCMLKNCRPTNANGSTMNTSPDAAFEQLQNKVGEECEHQNEARYRCVPTLIYKSWTAACIFHYIYIYKHWTWCPEPVLSCSKACATEVKIRIVPESCGESLCNFVIYTITFKNQHDGFPSSWWAKNMRSALKMLAKQKSPTKSEGVRRRSDL